MKTLRTESRRERHLITAITCASVVVVLFAMGLALVSEVEADCCWSENHTSEQRPMGRTCPMGGGMPGISLDATKLPEPTSSGAVAFKNYCAQCHALPSPKSHSARHWQVAVDRMLARMRRMDAERTAPWGKWMPNVQAPSAKEASELLNYLQRHALRSLPEEKLPSPTHPGARVFSETCSRCHALPDPSQHSPSEWPQVVERMQVNTQQMGTPPIDDTAATKILGYLKQAARPK